MNKTVNTMTVGKLLDQLKNMPSNLPIYTWVDGDRYPIVEVNDFWVHEGGWVD